MSCSSLSQRQSCPIQQRGADQLQLFLCSSLSQRQSRPILKRGESVPPGPSFARTGCLNGQKYSLTNVWLKEYFSKFWENMVMVQEEDNLIFPKFCCKACYQKMYRHYKAYDKHKGKEIKLPMNRRKPFEYPFQQIDFPTDQEFAHSVNSNWQNWSHYGKT